MVVAVVSKSDVGSFSDMEQTRYPDGLHVGVREREEVRMILSFGLRTGLVEKWNFV